MSAYAQLNAMPVETKHPRNRRKLCCAVVCCVVISGLIALAVGLAVDARGGGAAANAAATYLSSSSSSTGGAAAAALTQSYNVTAATGGAAQVDPGTQLTLAWRLTPAGKWMLDASPSVDSVLYYVYAQQSRSGAPLDSGDASGGLPGDVTPQELAQFPPDNVETSVNLPDGSQYASYTVQYAGGLRAETLTIYVF